MSLAQTPPWTPRPARRDDAAVIAVHRYAGAGTAQDLLAYERWVAPRIEQGGYAGVLAEVDGVVVAGAGAVMLDWGPTRGEPIGVRARIVNVFTAPAWRRRGLARSLVQALISQCQARQVQVFSLAATPDSAALYAALGFMRYPQEMILRG